MKKKRGLHSAMQKFHANQASSKKFATPEIRTQLNTPFLRSLASWAGLLSRTKSNRNPIY